MLISKVNVLLDNTSMTIFVTNTKNLTSNVVRGVVKNYLRKGNRNSNIQEIDYAATYSVTPQSLEKLSENYIIINL